MIRALSLALALSLTFCSLACAHDLWVQQSGNELQVVSGHEGVTTPCDPAKVREVKAFDPAGKLKKTETGFQGKAAVMTVPGGVAAVTAYYEEGFSSMTPEKSPFPSGRPRIPSIPDFTRITPRRSLPGAIP
ncbi:MAG: hypothetical protein V1791_07610 [Pseudomonadota bacterium]